jgi:hypothetical protein
MQRLSYQCSCAFSSEKPVEHAQRKRLLFHTKYVRVIARPGSTTELLAERTPHHCLPLKPRVFIAWVAKPAGGTKHR